MTFAIHSQKWNHIDGTVATTFHIMETRGYGFVEAYLNEDGLAIGNLSVDDEYRMQGMATEMLDVLENFVPKFQYLLDDHQVVVEVEPNAPNWLVRFYKKRGYVVNVRSYDGLTYKLDFQELPKKNIHCMVCSNYHCDDCEHHTQIDPNAKIEVVNTDELHKSIQDLENIYHCEGCKPTYDEWRRAGIQLGYNERDLEYEEYQFWNGDLDYTR